MRILIEHLRRTASMGILATLGAGIFGAIAMRSFAGIVMPAGTDILAASLPKQFQAALGIDKLPFNTLNGFLVVIIQHPFLLSIMMGLTITLATGLLTREVESGTLPLLLVRRVGRMQIVLSAAIVMALWTLTASAAVYVGIVYGAQWAHVTPLPDRTMVARLVAGLAMLSLSVSGCALAISTINNERGEAVQWCLVPLLIMYVWNFLAMFWPQAARVAKYLLFHYYAPVEIILQGRLDPQSTMVFAGVGGAGLLIALIVYWRREFNL